MNVKNVLALVLLFSYPLIASEAGEKKSFELPKVDVIPITETATERQYELYIKLPEEYLKNSEKKYPVIYFTDAIWAIEILSGSTEYLMEDAILVGISWQLGLDDEKEYLSRFRDYSVKESSDPERQAKYQFGQASTHLNFIRNDVITYVEKNYRAAPDERTYFGYSAGGLFGAYVLLAQPNTFKNYILGSPSVKGNIPELSKLGLKRAISDESLSVNVLISNGTLETELSESVEKYIDVLKGKSNSGLALKRVVVEGSHQTAVPMSAVRGITWLTNLARDEK